MQKPIRRWALCASFALLGISALVAGCGKSSDATPAAPAASSAQGTVPPPPGDSTPKAADATTRQAVEGNNEKTGNPGGSAQSTVGTAASGAPPYSLNSAPEGNTAPSQGTKAGEPAKK